MKCFVDTNVFVAYFLLDHPHHSRAKSIIRKVQVKEASGFASAHSLLEVYSVFTNLPLQSSATPALAAELIRQNIVQYFNLILLDPGEYLALLERMSMKGIRGGQIYDGLHLECALKGGAEFLYTFDERHFRPLLPERSTIQIIVP